MIRNPIDADSAYKPQRQDLFWLHEGRTKTGKSKYFFSPKAEGDLLDTIPVGYEIYEHPNAQVFLIKELPKIITDDEKTVVEKQLKALKSSRAYMIDIKGKVITIFESSVDIGAMAGIFAPYLSSRSLPHDGLRAILERSASYAPIMRFAIVNEIERIFVPERFCFRGSVNEWIYIGGGDSLEVVAKKYIPHLGQESFYELY